MITSVVTFPVQYITYSLFDSGIYTTYFMYLVVIVLCLLYMIIATFASVFAVVIYKEAVHFHTDKPIEGQVEVDSPIIQ